MYVPSVLPPLKCIPTKSQSQLSPGVQGNHKSELHYKLPLLSLAGSRALLAEDALPPLRLPLVAW